MGLVEGRIFGLAIKDSSSGARYSKEIKPDDVPITGLSPMGEPIWKATHVHVLDNERTRSLGYDRFPGVRFAVSDISGRGEYTIPLGPGCSLVPYPS